jgi:hypothetical protein
MASKVLLKALNSVRVMASKVLLKSARDGPAPFKLYNFEDK